MKAHELAWLQRCRDIADYLNAGDTEEWAFDPAGGRALLTTETGLELTLRQEQRRIVVKGWFGDMSNFGPRKPTASGYEWVSYRITEDARKADRVVATAILRRLLPRYRAGFAETSARYAEHQHREAWEQETRQAICSAFRGSSPASQGETIYLRDHVSGINGKAEVCAIYGVHLTLRGLSRDQALHILAYLEKTRDQRHTLR